MLAPAGCCGSKSKSILLIELVCICLRLSLLWLAIENRSS